MWSEGRLSYIPIPLLLNSSTSGLYQDPTPERADGTVDQLCLLGPVCAAGSRRLIGHALTGPPWGRRQGQKGTRAETIVPAWFGRERVRRATR